MTIEAGDKAPPFTLPDAEGGTISLADYSGEKVVLYFYPKAFTSGCTTQACDFRDDYDEFRGGGYEILGVSPDPVDRLADFRAEHDLPFPMLSDEDHTVATAYGAWGTQTYAGNEYEGIIRSTFVIGPDGAIEHAWRKVKPAGHGDRLKNELGI